MFRSTALRPLRYAFLFLLVGLACVSTAVGDTLYTYTGNTFNSSTNATGYSTPDTCPSICSITGAFAVTSPGLTPGSSPGTITVSAFSFTDGVNWFDQGNSTASITIYATGATGLPTAWFISIDAFNQPSGLDTFLNTANYNSGAGGMVVSDASGVEHCDGGVCTMIYNENGPGNWTAQEVPEPASIVLLGGGLAAFGLRRRARLC